MSGALKRKRRKQALARATADTTDKRATHVGGFTTRHGRTQEGATVKTRTRVTRHYSGPAGECVVITPSKQ